MQKIVIEIITLFLGWYLVTQIVTVAAMPLALHYFRFLPDRGFAFARIFGILLLSFLLWLGTSYRLLHNDSGGVWLALLLVALLSIWVTLTSKTTPEQPLQSGPDNASRVTMHLSRLRSLLPPWPYLLSVELLFFFAFAAWTWVRAQDPAINHTEQPMDLMFMNGIWTSAAYPPRDPWLAGYAISYYYFGYWMVMTLARMAGQAPEIAYNVGQACWFGLLLTGSFGIGYNLVASEAPTSQATDHRPLATAMAAGFLTSMAIGLTGNLHVILEWLYAQGVPLDRVTQLFDVYNFPQQAQVSGLWYMDNGWSWWWRASRVIEDLDLLGNHIEIIDEFPIFSYILGDNHPHVLAMPFVLLVVAMALNWFNQPGGAAQGAVPGFRIRIPWRKGPNTPTPLFTAIPLGFPGLLLLTTATGALIFLNTWDFPPYWLLLVLVVLFKPVAGKKPHRPQKFLATGPWPQATVVAGLLLLGTLLLYLPYFLTAQSQAGGILPNLFHPTRLPQFLLMFGHFLLAIVGLLLIAWREQPPAGTVLATSTTLVLGLPVMFLLVSGMLATTSDQSLMVRLALPADANSYGELMLQRRLSQPWTFLLMGSLASITLALLWQRLVEPGKASVTMTFVLFLVAIGVLLAYAPEFVYLRDNFGTRMNTIFKFYYQSWLLLGTASVYAIATQWPVKTQGQTTGHRPLATAVPSALSLLLIIACLIYPVAGVYAKISGSGTSQPTLNGIAYINADEQAVIEWIRRNTVPDAIILEAKGASYRWDSARISAASGRATLLGWDGHQSQWRGDAYGEMAAGRAEAIQEVYQRPNPTTLRELLQRWQIDYVLVGPAERAQYGITPALENRLMQTLDIAFEQGAYRILVASGQ